MQILIREEADAMKRIWKRILVLSVAVAVSAGSGMTVKPVFASEDVSTEENDLREKPEELTEDPDTIQTGSPEMNAEADITLQSNPDIQSLSDGELAVPDEDTGEQADATELQTNTVALSAAEEDTVQIVVNGLPEAMAESEKPVSVSNTGALPDEEVTVTAAVVDGYYLAQIRYAYQADQDTVYMTTDTTDGQAVFSMPADQVTVYADYISVVWDGTVDLTWYDAEQSVYDIRYPAQFAGAAVLCNGLFNDIPTREITVSGKRAKIPDLVDAGGNAVGLDETLNRKELHGKIRTADGSGYQTFPDLDGDAVSTTVVGDLNLVDIYNSKFDSGSNNVVSSDNFWYGSEDFTGKTIRLADDLDMGGRVNGLKTVFGSWSGPNYISLGGNYCMDASNGYTRIYAGFNGVLDGCGHEVYNIYFNRSTSAFGDCAGCGLVGVLGVSRVELGTQGKPVVKNVAVDGYFRAGRMSGGIVGSMGHSKGAKVDSCINFATVQSLNGGKGQGGIVGNGSFSPEFGDRQPTVSNCVNFGYICTGYNKNAGGLVGLSELLISDSYTVGFAAGEGNGNEEAGNIFGTNNGGAVWYNCYGLEGSATAVKNNPGVTTPLAYGATKGSAMRMISSLDTMRTAVFSGLLNGKVKSGAPDENGYMNSDDDIISNTKRNWVSSEDVVWISPQVQKSLKEMAAYHDPQTILKDKTAEGVAEALLKTDMTGLPVPAAFATELSALKELKTSGTPKTEYLSNETFDTGNHAKQAESPQDPDGNEFAVWAVFDDGSYTQISDYTVIYQNGGNAFRAGDTKVTIEANFGGQTLKKTVPVVVTEAELLSLGVVSQPKNSLYSKDEYFNPDGLILQMQYGSGDGKNVTVSKKIRAEFSETGTVIRQYVDTVQGTDNYETLSEEAAEAYQFSFTPSVEKKLGTNDKKVVVTHTYADTALTAEIPVTVLATAVGGDQIIKDPTTTTIHISNEDEFIWFANQISSDLDPDLYAVLENDITITRTSFLPVGVKDKKIVSYQGVFDGNGHKITLNLERSGSGAEGRAALFYKIASGAEVKNLTVAGSITGSDMTAGITVLLSGGTISGCTNQAKITSTKSIAGGILAQTDAENGRVEACANEGSVSGAGNTGGIAGSFTGKNGVMTACQNAGVIQNTDESYKTESAAGGLAGTLGAAIISLSKNTGSVSGVHNAVAGGIAGKVTVSNTPVIDSCYNRGSVTVKGLIAEVGTVAAGTSDRGGIGGIIGRTMAGVTMKSCYSTGQVSISYEAVPAASELPSVTAPAVLLTGKDAAGASGGLIGITSDLKKVSDNYVLNGTAASITGSRSRKDGVSPAETNAVWIDDEDLRAAGVVAKLNAGGEDYQIHKGFYPLLSWETLNGVFRIYGKSRYDTSIGIADTIAEENNGEKFGAVIVTTGANYADALSGSYLAKVKAAPLLIINPKDSKQISQTTDYIRKHLRTGGVVYILGGTNAVPKTVEKNLSGITYKRLDGADRYETNLKILKEAGVGNEEVLVCTGTNYADSLSASATGKPILLVGKELNGQQKTWLNGLSKRHYEIIGGTAAVNQTVEKQIRAYASDVHRLAGDTRYQTSVSVAKRYFENPEKAILSVANNYPDGLCGGPLAQKESAPLLLINEGKANDANAYCAEKQIRGGYVLGGPGLISDELTETVLQVR